MRTARSSGGGRIYAKRKKKPNVLHGKRSARGNLERLWCNTAKGLGEKEEEKEEGM